MNVVWFKRDLRIVDHAPLVEAAKLNLPVLPLYIVEPRLWQQPDASGRHWYFIRDCLLELREKLSVLGQLLVIRVGEAVDVLSVLHTRYKIDVFYSHEETGNGLTFALA